MRDRPDPTQTGTGGGRRRVEIDPSRDPSAGVEDVSESRSTTTTEVPHSPPATIVVVRESRTHTQAPRWWCVWSGRPDPERTDRAAAIA